ncbi:MAG: TolC family protein [Bacteroidetes bacterium]|nr:TolC family protein [Bacteroidota bacterium]
MKTVFTILILLITQTALPGQTQTLDDYIRTGLENNLQLRQKNLDLQAEISRLKQSRSLFFPNVDLASSYTKASGGRTIDFPVGDLLDPVYQSLNDLTGSNFPTNLENVNEQLIPDNFHDTRLQISQPLFNTDIYYSYKARKSAVSVVEAQRDAYRQELIKEIKLAYYRYAQSEEAMRILESNRRQLEELKRLNRSLVENGKATEDAVYRAQYQLDELDSDLAETRSRTIAARSHFNFLLNRDLQDSIHVAEPSPEVQTTLQTVPRDRAIETALQGREEIVALESEKQATQQLLNLEKASYLPTLYVGASIGYQGEAFRFGGDEDYQLLRVSLSIPIFRGLQRHHKVEEARISLRQSETRLNEVRRQIRLQVIQAHENLRAAREHLTAKESKRRSAQKTFEIIEKKYREGQVLLIDFLDAQTNYLNSRLEVNIAAFRLKQEQAAFERTLSI